MNGTCTYTCVGGNLWEETRNACSDGESCARDSPKRKGLIGETQEVNCTPDPGTAGAKKHRPKKQAA